MRLIWGGAPPTIFSLFTLALGVACLLIAFLRPAWLASFFVATEIRLAVMSRKRGLCGLIVFLFPIIIRLVLLPVYPPPTPFVHDEYAYLLQSDTYSSGRLANPPAPFPNQFESIYILATPTYSAEYEPAQGLFLAVGQKLWNKPWFGVVLSTGLFCAASYWALLAWLPLEWAFVGAVLMAVEIGVLSYWMNSYWGGSVPGIGGALLLGGLARLCSAFRPRDAALIAIGFFVLFGSRPLEAALLGIMLAGFFLFWLVTKKMSLRVFLARVALPIAVVALPCVWFFAVFNQRVTGKAGEVPYLLYRARWALPQGFYWQKRPIANRSMPVDIKGEYLAQVGQRERGNTLGGVAIATVGKLRRFWEFYIGVLLSFPLVALPFIWRKPNMEIALFSLLVIVAFENFTYFSYFPHYSAAVASIIFLVLVQCLRVLRTWGAPGLFLSRTVPLACFAALCVAVGGRLIQPVLPSPLKPLSALWASEYDRWVSRERFVPRLQAQPGKHLVLIHYNASTHQDDDAWTFNNANLETSKIVWARESEDPDENRRLMQYFSGRKVWLAEPDAKPQRIVPYPKGR
jgi:hypothetical protein